MELNFLVLFCIIDYCILIVLFGTVGQLSAGGVFDCVFIL